MSLSDSILDSKERSLDVINSIATAKYEENIADKL